MKIFIAGTLFALVVACGGKQKKKEEPIVGNEQASEDCCCRIEGDSPDDLTYSRVKVMECSSRHGECLKTDAQCAGQIAPEPTEPEPKSEAPPTSF